MYPVTRGTAAVSADMSASCGGSVHSPYSLWKGRASQCCGGDQSKLLSNPSSASRALVRGAEFNSSLLATTSSTAPRGLFSPIAPLSGVTLPGGAPWSTWPAKKPVMETGVGSPTKLIRPGLSRRPSWGVRLPMCFCQWPKWSSALLSRSVAGGTSNGRHGQVASVGSLPLSRFRDEPLIEAFLGRVRPTTCSSSAQHYGALVHRHWLLSSWHLPSW